MNDGGANGREPAAEGPVAIITGAASGIGRHWAQVLAEHADGYRLALGDINAAGLREAFESGDRLQLYSMDIRLKNDWRRVVDGTLQRYGRIDYLFNIAGGGRPRFLLELPLEDVDFGIDLNLKGPLYGMKLASEVMRAQGSGQIVNVGSLAGLAATPGNLLYSAAKAGLRHASLAAAVELRPYGVYVTLVSPDLVETPIYYRNLSRGAEAALAYSGPKPLSVSDLEQAFWRAMGDKPLEISLPRQRGWLAKLNDLIPGLMLRLYEPLKRRGLEKMEAARRKLDGQAQSKAPENRR